MSFLPKTFAQEYFSCWSSFFALSLLYFLTITVKITNKFGLRIKFLNHKVKFSKIPAIFVSKVNKHYTATVPANMRICPVALHVRGDAAVSFLYWSIQPNLQQNSAFMTMMSWNHSLILHAVNKSYFNAVYTYLRFSIITSTILPQAPISPHNNYICLQIRCPSSPLFSPCLQT